MSVNTSNIYGKISISDKAIARLVSHACYESYGVVGLDSFRFTDSLSELFRKDRFTKGVKVTTTGDRIKIEVSVIIKFGVSISAVADSLKESIKYKVEKLTGMIVSTIDVNIIGVKL
ncbi:MAG TPA: Asp23/Gls24 family envelope stress response protein [Clostridiales bacterium]|nr:Asp23/Gls24 family envelope stress response protein [Clostridiales bacterium]HBJ97666.1 Asp23/Gls24 family envelope stress response protein [Clostridiales bacterium]